MRENYGYYHKLKNCYSVYSVEGLNLDRLINLMNKKQIGLFNLKKQSNKYMTFAIKDQDNQKFFAIVKNLCYNNLENSENAQTKGRKGLEFKKFFQRLLLTKPKTKTLFVGSGYKIRLVKRKGKAYPFKLLLNNLGVLVGALVFIIATTYSNDFVFNVQFTGTGSAVKGQIQTTLQDCGAIKGARFSKIDLKRLGDLLVVDNPNLSFAECYKRGNVLVVESALRNSNNQKINYDVGNLFADCNGVVETVKVYRGTAIVKSGDEVKEGDLLVGGFVEVKEQTVAVNVLATVTINCKKDFIYKFNSPDHKETALALAKDSVGDMQILSTLITVEKQNQEFIYSVTVSFRHVVTAG